MFENLKSYFFNKRLLKEASENKSRRQLMDFREAKEIGIVYDASNFHCITEVRDYQNQLKEKGKNVSVYAYINSSDKKDEPYLITNKNLNWYGYPTKNQLFEFANKEFDVLFGFFNEVHSPLNAIFANSKSKLRIGVNYNQDNSLFDIMIGSSRVKNCKDIISILTEFLTSVRTK